MRLHSSTCRHIPNLVTVGLAGLLALPSCRLVTGVDEDAGCGPRGGRDCTHPSALSRVDVIEPGHPFAVRVSRTGVVYSGEQHNERLGVYRLPATTLQGGITVGSVPTDVAFTPDGTRAFVTNQGSRTVGIIDVATGIQMDSIPLADNPYRVLVSADGARTWVTTANGSVVTIDNATRAQSTLAIGGNLNGIAQHPAGHLLYVSSTSGRIHEIAVPAMTRTRTIEFAVSQYGGYSGGGVTPQDLAVSLDGTTLYVANEAGPLQVISTATFTRTGQADIASYGFGMAMTPDGAHLYVTRPGMGEVVVLDRATLSVVTRLMGGSPRRVAFDATGATAVIGNEAGWVSFIR